MKQEPADSRGKCPGITGLREEAGEAVFESADVRDDWVVRRFACGTSAGDRFVARKLDAGWDHHNLGAACLVALSSAIRHSLRHRDVAVQFSIQRAMEGDGSRLAPPSSL